MIITPDDYRLIDPSTTLTNEVLLTAINFIQSVIESSRGCNRKIEITEYEIKRTLNQKYQTFFLPYLPVIEVDKLEVRIANAQDNFRRPIPTQEWFEITDYTVDLDGQIHIDLYSAIGNFFPIYHKRSCFTEAKIKYTAGLDFSQNTDTINQLKACALECLKFVLNSGLFKGVQELDVPFDEFRIKYSSSLNPGEIPDSFLLPFKKYRPVSTV